MSDVHVSIAVVTSKEDNRVVGICSLEHNGHETPDELMAFAAAMRLCDSCSVAVMTAPIPAGGRGHDNSDVEYLLNDIMRRN